MICEHCGKEIPEDTYFCPECGMKKETPPMQESGEKTDDAKKKKGGFLKVLIPLMLAAVLITVIVITVKNRKQDDTIAYENYISCIGNSFFWNMEGNRYSAQIEEFVFNRDNSVAAYTVSEGDTLTSYCIDNGLEPKRVAEDVVSFSISYTGEYIGYVADAENDVAGTLYLYCVEEEKAEEIADNVYPEYFCLSPSGKAISFIKDYAHDDDYCMYIGGVSIKEKEVSDDNCAPVAITDNGKTLYYINDDYKLYVFNGKESEKLASGVGNYFFFNQDLSEMLFSEDGATYYYTRDLEEPLLVSDDAIVNVLVKEKIARYTNMNGLCTIFGETSFKGSVLQTDDGIYWFNKEGTDAVRMSSVETEGLCVISEDGKSAICVMNSGLYEIDKLSDKMEAKLLYDEEEIQSVYASGDLSKIYLVINGELHYLKGKNKTVEFADDLGYGPNPAAYHDEAKKIYYAEEGILYCAGTKESSIEVVAENVTAVYAFADGVVYITNDGTGNRLFYIGEKETVEIATY